MIEAFQIGTLLKEIAVRVNVYAEEITDRVEIVSKVVNNEEFTGIRFYLELPAQLGQAQVKGPFIHHAGDDDSSAVTFWGKRDLRITLRKALEILDEYYSKHNVREF